MRYWSAGEVAHDKIAHHLPVLIGQNSQPASLVTRTVVQRQLTLRGSLIYDHPDDFAATLALAGQVTPSRVLNACYPLADASAAFQAARQVPGKTWIQVKD